MSGVRFSVQTEGAIRAILYYSRLMRRIIFICLVTLGPSVFLAPASAWGAIELACTWNSGGEKRTEFFRVDLESQTVAVLVSANAYEIIPTEITDTEILYGLGAIDRKTGSWYRRRPNGARILPEFGKCQRSVGFSFGAPALSTRGIQHQIPGSQVGDGGGSGPPTAAPDHPISSASPHALNEPPPLALPEFPWPPPTASTSYVLPPGLLKNHDTVGQVSEAIVSGLERAGYVERSFFRTSAAGVALVTRLERINDDGTARPENERWPADLQDDQSAVDLAHFLRGLFYVDRGHYRIIVFVLQEAPYTQSPNKIGGEEARAWLRNGTNSLPRDVADRPFSTGTCSVLIYEFTSNGNAVHLVESHLTAKQHLEKSGLLARIEGKN